MRSYYKLFVLLGIAGAIVAGKAVQDITKGIALTPKPEVKQKPKREPPKIAPEFTDAEKTWFNTENSKPVRLADLKGKKVVLVHFWHAGSAECAQIQPYILRLLELYKDKGLAAIGVHTPPPADKNGSDLRQVEQKIQEGMITYPVVIDDSRRLWKAYNAQFYPTFYVIDKVGKVHQKLDSDSMNNLMELAGAIGKLCR